MRAAWLPPSPLSALPVLGVGVLEQLGQLQGVFADFLHGGEQEAIQGDVNHLLQQAAGLEEVHVLVDLGEARQLHAGVRVVVAVLRVDLELCLLQGTHRALLPVLRLLSVCLVICILSLELIFILLRLSRPKAWGGQGVLQLQHLQLM